MDRREAEELYDSGKEPTVAKLLELDEENRGLKQKIASLQTDSTNSSKPPSSDGLKKKRNNIKRSSSGKSPGGQKGHPGKTRTKVPPNEISKIIPHKPETCEECGAHLSEDNPTIPVEIRQVLEIPEIKPEVCEHIFYKTTCICGHQTRLPVPEWMYSGVGENLQAYIAYLTAEAKLSRRTLQTILKELFNVPMAVGTIQNRLEDTSEALKPVCEELKEEITKQEVVNIDETGFPHNKTIAWLWAFITSTFALFTIQKERSSKVLKKILKKAFDGIIICDRFSAYVKYHKDRACGLIQYCWAHIIRDIKAIGYELAYDSNKIFSVLMRQRIGAVFRLWHLHKRGGISRQQLIETAEVLIKEIRAFLEENQKASSQKVSRFSEQLLKRWNSLFTFIYHEGVEPTNNLAERLIRAGVLLRKISYCTRSKNGQLLRARLLTVSQTCRMKKRNSLEFFRRAIHAKRNNLTFPSLLPEQQNNKLQKVA